MSSLTDDEINEWFSANGLETRRDVQKFLLKVIDDLENGRIDSREANKRTRYANAALMQLRKQVPLAPGISRGKMLMRGNANSER